MQLVDTHTDHLEKALGVCHVAKEAEIPDQIRDLGKKLYAHFDETKGDTDRITYVESLLKSYLARPHLLSDLKQPQGRNTYTRHLLFADPKKRFTILALYWPTGVTTSIHGHNAWGVVGVYDGAVAVTCYEKVEIDGGAWTLTESANLIVGPGVISTVRPDPDGIHRIHNPFSNPAWTVHIYGMDLLTDPVAINVVYAG